MTSTIVHPSGTVVATSSGQRHVQEPSYDDSDDEYDSDLSEDGDDQEDSDSSASSGSSRPPLKIPDNSLKAWSLI